jgi:biotin carboxyl carrier protein|tara:strand:- start:565 stop:1047 length:483 start_codon:yes stop_codon:yes gene_type:complete|mmetsp:Transcript_12534/g.41661  ORF Transcript_12534/g.41661 Transcript_12534/m.41661 type:complete len:161 (-) Transcript_12534:95-577(-)
MLAVAARRAGHALRHATTRPGWSKPKPVDPGFVWANSETLANHKWTLFTREFHHSTPSPSHDDAAVARGDPEWHIVTPVISDQVSIPDGVVGDVAEINVLVGDVVEEGHVAVIIETHKACLNVKVTGARRLRVLEILTEIGAEVREHDALVLVENADKEE